jgi:hypothetical protein
MRSHKTKVIFALLAISSVAAVDLIAISEAEACCRWFRRAVNSVTRAVSRGAQQVWRRVPAPVRRVTTNTIGHIARTATRTGHTIARTATRTGHTIARTAARTGHTIARTATRTGRTIARTAARTGNTIVRGARRITTTVIRTAERVGNTIVTGVTSLAERTRDLANQVGSAVSNAAKMGFQALAEAAKKAWDSISAGFKWLGNKIIEWTSEAIAKVISPMKALIRASVEREVKTRYARRLSRMPAGQCQSFFGLSVGDILRTAFTSVLGLAVPTFTSGLSMWSSNMLAQGMVRAGAAQHVTAGGRQTLSQQIAANFSAGLYLKAAAAKIAIAVATFPVGYLSAAWACDKVRKSMPADDDTSDEAAQARREGSLHKYYYKKCYTTAFVDDYAKGWLWDNLITMGLIPVDVTLLTPLAIKVGAMVTAIVAAQIAAATSGFGAIAAPAIGFLVGLLVKIGATLLITEAVKQVFYKLYERTTWKASRNFFTKLIGDAWKTFGPGGIDPPSQTTTNAAGKPITNPVKPGKFDGFTDPAPIGGTAITSSPAVASWGKDRYDVFSRGPNGDVIQRYYDGVWRDGGSLGGRIRGAPAAVSWGRNRIDVFARGMEDALWHKFWNGTRWSEWTNLGGCLAASPAVAAWTSNRLDVVVRGCDDQVYRRQWDGSKWLPYQAMGGRTNDAPAIAARGGDKLDITVRGADNALWARSYARGQWDAWRKLDGCLRAGPTMASPAFDTLEVYVRGCDDKLYAKAFDGTWRNYRNLGGKFDEAPAAISTERPKIDLFVRTSDGSVYHASAGQAAARPAPPPAAKPPTRKPPRRKPPRRR